MGWMACYLALFDYEDFSNASAGWALSEAILQCFTSYTMGFTADVGRTRRFYYADALVPYHRGPAADRMYAGALMWIIACVLIIIGWVSFVFLMHRFLRFRRKRTAAERAKKLKVLLAKISDGSLGPTQFKAEMENEPLLKPTEYNDQKIEHLLKSLATTPMDNYQRFRKRFIRAVLSLGFFSFLAQLLFWEGYVKSSGSR
jgi:hypothetical protein